MDPDVEDQIADLVSSGNKIAAIKRHREATGSSLAEAKRAVEDIAAGRSIDASETDLSDLAAEVLEALESGNKITAIKIYRQRTNASLKEAKNVVEEIAAKAGMITPSSSGCAGLAIAALSGAGGLIAVAASLLFTRGQ